MRVRWPRNNKTSTLSSRAVAGVTRVSDGVMTADVTLSRSDDMASHRDAPQVVRAPPYDASTFPFRAQQVERGCEGRRRLRFHAGPKDGSATRCDVRSGSTRAEASTTPSIICAAPNMVSYLPVKQNHGNSETQGCKIRKALCVSGSCTRGEQPTRWCKPLNAVITWRSCPRRSFHSVLTETVSTREIAWGPD